MREKPPQHRPDTPTTAIVPMETEVADKKSTPAPRPSPPPPLELPTKTRLHIRIKHLKVFASQIFGLIKKADYNAHNLKSFFKSQWSGKNCF